MERNAIPELDYLTQISFELYESESKSEPGENEGDPNTSAYSIRIAISPGCHSTDPLDMHLDSKHCIGCNPRKSLTSHLEWKYVVETLREKFHRVKLPNRFIPINLGEPKYRSPVVQQTVAVAGDGEGKEAGKEGKEEEAVEVKETVGEVVKEVVAKDEVIKSEEGKGEEPVETEKVEDQAVKEEPVVPASTSDQVSPESEKAQE